MKKHQANLFKLQKWHVKQSRGLEKQADRCFKGPYCRKLARQYQRGANMHRLFADACTPFLLTQQEMTTV